MIIYRDKEIEIEVSRSNIDRDGVCENVVGKIDGETVELTPHEYDMACEELCREAKWAAATSY